MNKVLWLSFSFCFLLLSSCQQKSEARKPINHTGESALKASVNRNKDLIQDENQDIQNYILKDSIDSYIASSQGFWYKFNNQNLKDSIRPKKGDLVSYEYEIRDLQGATIYSKEAIGTKTYQVDQEDLLIGLRHGLKLMKKGETAEFIFPSPLAYGYSGDQNKIGINQPLVFKVRLIQIQPEL